MSDLTHEPCDSPLLSSDTFAGFILFYARCSCKYYSYRCRTKFEHWLSSHLSLGDLVGIPLPFQMSSDDDAIIGMRNALTQSFRYLESGDTFAVSANHFKSKGSECLEDAAPSAQDDIQGSCNALRVSAAVALGETLSAMDLPEKLLIVGDLNCYTNEDPMAVLTSFSNRPYDIMTGGNARNGDAPETVRCATICR